MTHLPPGPGAKLVGYILAARDHPQAFLADLIATYGDIVYVPSLNKKNYLISHPDMIRDALTTNAHLLKKGPETALLGTFLGNGILTSEDPQHVRNRRIMQPVFHRKSLEHVASGLVQTTLNHSRAWHAEQVIAINDTMSALSQDMVMRSLFRVSLAQEQASAIRQDIATVLSVITQYNLLPLATTLFKLPLPATRTFHRARQRLTRLFAQLVADHHQGQDSGDLLAMLLAAHDDEHARLTTDEIDDELLTLFFAGQETTAAALSWTWDLLARHPDIEARWHEELATVLGGRVPTVADLPQLVYTRMIVSESLRLYPPIFALSRTVLEPYPIGDYMVPRGGTLYMVQYAVQRDARWWPDPQRFDPERFTPEQIALRPKYSYFPFGGGSRQCIGEHFAWLELILVLATLGQQWRLRPTSDVPIAFAQQIITLRSKRPILLQLEAR